MCRQLLDYAMGILTGISLNAILVHLNTLC